MSRRRRAFPGWWTLWFAIGMIVLMLVGFLAGATSLLSLLTTAVLVGFVIAVVVLAEAQMALQHARLHAVEDQSRGHLRELSVYADHATRAINDIRRVSPAAAIEREAALTLDLTRLHALGAHLHRREHHG